MDPNPNFNIGIQSSRPRWMGDYSGREHVMPVPVKLDPAQFNGVDAVKVTVGAAGAAADAVLVPVTALSGPIPTGTVIDLGGKKFARLTAAALKDATTLTVANLATALVAGDTGTYAGVGKKQVPSGTLIGRTLAERDTFAAWGPAAVDTDDEIYLTVREAADLVKNNDTVVTVNLRVVKENYLPGFTALAAGVKTEIRALYQCITGVN